VYANSITRTEEDDKGGETEREIHYMKGYSVFNVEQIEGLPEHYYGKSEVKLTPVERISHAEEFFKATKADVRYRGDRAYYSNDGDYIQMPVIEAFRDAESFNAALAHESAHWTKHPSRLDRDFGRKQWGFGGGAVGGGRLAHFTASERERLRLRSFPNRSGRRRRGPALDWAGKMLRATFWHSILLTALIGLVALAKHTGSRE
jgi:hypothetical protein